MREVEGQDIYQSYIGSSANPGYRDIAVVAPGMTSIAFEPIDEFYVARARECHGDGHVIVGGRNDGQGSSREQAALAVRNLGARVVLAHSIARIHGENLVNYGVLPLLFVYLPTWSALKKGRCCGFTACTPGCTAPSKTGKSHTALTAEAKGASRCGMTCRRARSTFCSPAAPSPGCGAAPTAKPTAKPHKKPQVLLNPWLQEVKMKIAVLPGDGIGPEIVREAVKVLNGLGESFEYEEAPIGGAGYDASGDPLPDATLAEEESLQC